MTPIRLLALLIAAYAVICMVAIRVTPYRTAGHLISRMQTTHQGDIGAPDERQHINYIRHLADGKGFPVFDPKAHDLYNTYQSHQPPLYYLLGAPLAAIAHGDEATERWLLRGLSVVIGSLTLIAIFFGARRFTDNEWVALFATAFTATLPTFIALTSAVTNDTLLMLMAALMMNVIASAYRKSWSSKHVAALGAVLGLALLTKTTGLLLFPVAAVALIASGDKRPSLLYAALPFLMALVIASPWLFRNNALYGDPLAIGAFREASVGNLNASDAIAVYGVGAYWFLWVAKGAIESFWGVFGYFDVFLTGPIYRVLSAGLVIMLIGLFRRSADGERRMQVVNTALFLLILLGFLAYNANYYQAQARYLYPAIFAIAASASLGLWRLCNRSPRTFGIAAIAWTVAMLVLDIYVVSALLPAKFALMQS